MAVGARRTTLTEIARRAGVSRMTLYRRYPDGAGVVRDLIDREFGAIVSRAEASARRSGTARGRLVTTVAATAARLRRSELFRRIVDVDPELLLRYVISDLGSMQRLAIEHLSTAIAAGHADGSVRPGDVRELAHVVLLLAQPFVVSAGTVAVALDESTLDRELSQLLDRYLAP